MRNHDYRSSPPLLAVFLALLLPAPASAQLLDEITVTARRQSESIQTAPVAVTAISGEQIESLGLEDLRDIARLTPGLRFDNLVAGLYSAPVIRGLAQTSVFGDNNVGTFIDGIYISNKAGLDISLLDLDRVEIVKGPQSAQYGRNTFAGAINYITRQPGDEFDARARVAAGEDGQLELRALMSGPLTASKVLKGGIAVNWAEYDGSYREATVGDNLGGYENRAVNGSLVLTPSDWFEATLGVYYADDSLGAVAVGRMANNCAPSAVGLNYFCGALPDADRVAIGNTTTRTPPTPPTAKNNDREVLLSRLALKFELANGYQIDSLTGYNDVTARNYGDFDRNYSGEPYALVGGGTAPLNNYFGQEFDTTDTSQEIRFSSPADRSFRWSVGAYYYDTELLAGSPAGIDLSAIPPGRTLAPNGNVALLGTPNGQTIPTYSQNITTAEQYSAFGSIEGDLGERITLIAELRYTEDERTSDVLRNAFLGGRDPDGPGFKAKFDFADTRLVARYQATDDLMLYGSAAQGSKAGGFNGSAILPEDVTYDPEFNWTYELGIKSAWLDKRIVANAAVFFVDWRDLQLVAPNSSPLSPATVIKNFGQAETYGLELEVAARVADGVDLSFGYAYTNPEFVDSYTTSEAAVCAAIPGCRTEIRNFSGANRLVVALDGYSLPRAFKQQFYAAASVEKPLTNAWDWFARADWSYNDKEYASPINQAWVDPREIANLRAGVRNENWRLTVYAENVFDDLTATTGTPTGSLSRPGLSFLDPVFGQNRRRIGVSAEYQF